MKEVERLHMIQYGNDGNPTGELGLMVYWVEHNFDGIDDYIKVPKEMNLVDVNTHNGTMVCLE